jgi:Domain of unknown function (DUF5610)
MSNPLSAIGANNTAPVKDKNDAATIGSIFAKARSGLNASIVQASLNVSIGSGNDPLALVYKSAMTNIHEDLKAQYGNDAVGNAGGQDNSAEATADRIVSLSTGFFDSYKKQHPGVDEATARKDFTDIIKKGVERGFKEARGILEGLKALGGDVGSTIDKTYELVMKGLNSFAAPPKDGATPDSATPDSAAKQ